MMGFFHTVGKIRKLETMKNYRQKKIGNKVISPDFVNNWDPQFVGKKKTTHCFQRNSEFKKYILYIGLSMN